MEWKSLTTLKGDHTRIISVKFGCNSTKWFRMRCYSKETADRRRTDDGHRMITIAHIDPMAHVS